MVPYYPTTFTRMTLLTLLRYVTLSGGGRKRVVRDSANDHAELKAAQYRQ